MATKCGVGGEGTMDVRWAIVGGGKGECAGLDV